MVTIATTVWQGLSDCTEVYQLLHSTAYVEKNLEAKPEVLHLAARLGGAPDEAGGGADAGGPSAAGESASAALVSVRQTVCEPLLYLDCPAQQGGVAFSRSEGKLAIGGGNLVTVFDIISGGTLFKQVRPGGGGTCILSLGAPRPSRMVQLARPWALPTPPPPKWQLRRLRQAIPHARVACNGHTRSASRVLTACRVCNLVGLPSRVRGACAAWRSLRPAASCSSEALTERQPCRTCALAPSSTTSRARRMWCARCI